MRWLKESLRDAELAGTNPFVCEYTGDFGVIENPPT